MYGIEENFLEFFLKTRETYGILGCFLFQIGTNGGKSQIRSINLAMENPSRLLSKEAGFHTFCPCEFGLHICQAPTWNIEILTTRHQKTFLINLFQGRLHSMFFCLHNKIIGRLCARNIHTLLDHPG